MKRPKNDLELGNGGWRNYPELNTSSLWIMKREDSRPLNGFVGANIPNIQRQLYPRYTQAGDVVLDPFVGIGTSLFVAEEMGRFGAGIDLDLEPFDKQPGSYLLVEPPEDKPTGRHIVIEGDSTEPWTYAPIYRWLREEHQRDQVQFAFLHPPYADMVVYSEDERDLSKEIEWFLPLMGKVFDQVYTILEPGRHMALLIADMYSKGRWVPLSYRTLEQAELSGFVPKAEIIKNMQDNEAKGKNANLWRYRHLLNGTYDFSHEKLFIFQKR